MWLAALSGCASLESKKPVPASVSDFSACCSNPERRPEWLVDLARPVAKPLGLTLAQFVWRKGHLFDQPEARAFVRKNLRPLDIMMVSSKGRLTGHTIPGLFGHAVIYLGSERELRSAGVWNDPAYAPHRKAIAGGKHFIEADWEGVHLSDENRVMNTDRIVILRPRVSRAARKAKALRDYSSSVGMPFDFRFDLDTPECTFCTELVRAVLPEINLPVTHVYGNHVVIPEAVIKAAHEGSARLEIITYVAGTKTGWEKRDRKQLAADIAAAWAKPK